MTPQEALRFFVDLRSLQQVYGGDCVLCGIREVRRDPLFLALVGENVGMDPPNNVAPEEPRKKSRRGPLPTSVDLKPLVVESPVVESPVGLWRPHPQNPDIEVSDQGAARLLVGGQWHDMRIKKDRRRKDVYFSFPGGPSLPAAKAVLLAWGKGSPKNGRTPPVYFNGDPTDLRLENLSWSR